MKVKFLHDHGYPSLKQVVGKVVNVVHSDDVTCMINGADLIAAGADEHYINPRGRIRSVLATSWAIRGAGCK
ncbi:hypothetical protein ACSN51_001727 [Escherichia coli]